MEKGSFTIKPCYVITTHRTGRVLIVQTVIMLTVKMSWGNQYTLRYALWLCWYTTNVNITETYFIQRLKTGYKKIQTQIHISVRAIFFKILVLDKTFPSSLVGPIRSFVVFFLQHNNPYQKHPEPCDDQDCSGKLAFLLRKTTPCSFYPRGTCANGDGCRYAHGDHELKEMPKWEMCERYMEGECPHMENPERVSDLQLCFSFYSYQFITKTYKWQ